MTQPLFDPCYRLQQLEVYNWGGFSGYHSAQVDAGGTAIVGPTGSGKTTLVDALMTLLGTNPKYNLASTGGHESDRDLVSYVRGVAGAGDGSGGQSHIARPAKTLTGICATLANSDDCVRLAVLLWMDGSSSAASDLQRVWIFAKGAEHSLQQWLSVHAEGGLRQLKQLGKHSEGLWLFSSKNSYLARVRSHFEVCDNAFNLLNRAAGLKQLNSIDEIFRELVLDDCAQFARAKEVADSFDDLTAIYQEIELARRQIRTLEPVQLYYRARVELQAACDAQARLVQHFPGWFAGRSVQRWQTEWQRLQDSMQDAECRVGEAERVHDEQGAHVQRLYAQFLQLGGSDVQSLQALIQRTEKDRDRCESNARDYQRLARELALDERLEQGVLLANQARLEPLLQGWQQAIDEKNTLAFSAGVSEQRLAADAQQVQDELDEVRRNPASNIAAPFLQFRQQLADALELDERSLPFVAELVQVKAQEQDWRGAIERAIGSHRLRVLVPARQMQQALAWVNGRDNRLHVRLLEVQAGAGAAQLFDDSFVHKLEFKQHAALATVQQLLAGIDRHCVDDVASLRRTEHAMTREGTLSGRAGYFDKQDQKRLQQDWQTGFDNRDRLQALEQQLAEARAAQQDAAQERRRLQGLSQQLEQRIRLAERLLELEFAQLDVHGQQRELEAYRQQLAQLTAPDSSLDAARQAHEQAQEQLRQLDQAKTQANRELASCQTLLQQAQNQLDVLNDRIDSPLSAETVRLFADYEPQLADCALNQLQPLERRLAEQLAQAQTALSGKLARKDVELAKAMEKAKIQNQGALADSGTELEDVPVYLQRLQVLVEEDLPAKQKRFREYLNRSSEDGVVQLLSEIDDEVERIRDRLDDVNATLQRVDFQPGRYLQIVAHNVQHESRRTLSTAMEALHHARYVEDDGEAHYKALHNIVTLLRDAVERQRTQPAKALLDPRFRLEFKVADISRVSGEVIETRSGSQGGSGGEKEIIASYVLTASLSYALCPDGSRFPLFASIVLDEAFSRSSHAVAGRIIDALSEFGLHPLFVTPNKEMRLLRNHTRSAIIVHRRGNESSLTCLSWQELDQLALARQRTEHTHENAG